MEQHTAVMRKEGAFGLSVRKDTDTNYTGNPLMGIADSHDEALEDLWARITDPSNIISVWVGGTIKNSYRWDEKEETLLSFNELWMPKDKDS